MPAWEWRGGARFAVAVCLTAQPWSISATVTVLAPLNTTGLWPNTHFPSSTFVYFGPRPGYWLSAPAVFLTDEEACAPNPAAVQGKVAVSRMSHVKCLIEDTYDALNKYGAAAFIVLVGVFFLPKAPFLFFF
jgi:hypothetical protein